MTTLESCCLLRAGLGTDRVGPGRAPGNGPEGTGSCSEQGCSNRESRESRGAKKRRFAPNREALNKTPNRPNRYLMTTAM